MVEHVPYKDGVVGSNPSLRTIGLIGGMSWESTVPYYRIINETVRRELGGLHSAKLILYSVDFHEVEELQRSGDWETAGAMLADAARALERAGAELLLIGTNTMHKVADAVSAAVRIPLFHIADATADAVKTAGFRRVGLLGTKFTMEQDFYRERLERAGLTVLTPPPEQRDEVHRVIYEELCLGRIEPASRETYRKILHELAAAGAEAIILGCTEIGLLVQAEDSPVPLFDTAAIHAEGAALQAIATAVHSRA